MLNILVAIPVYNERKYIKDVLDAVLLYHNNVLIVDDGSNDGCGEVIKQYPVAVVTHKKNEGYGKSLIDSFVYASNNQVDWIITMDCDCQHEPQYIDAFVSEINTNSYDIISGSRYVGQVNTEGVPAQRLIINQYITNLLNSIFKLNITDSFCGFKAYRVSAINKLLLNECGYAFPLQLWVQAAIANLNILEIPVPLIYHDPNRNFSGNLESPAFRINYYLNTLKKELTKSGFVLDGNISMIESELIDRLSTI